MAQQKRAVIVVDNQESEQNPQLNIGAVSGSFYSLIDRLQKHSEWKYPERKWKSWFTSEDKKLSCLQIVSEVKKIVPYLHLDKKETVEQMRANDSEFLDFWLEVESQIKKIQ